MQVPYRTLHSTKKYRIIPSVPTRLTFVGFVQVVQLFRLVELKVVAISEHVFMVACLYKY